MQDVEREGQAWTRLDVETSLITAFRKMPSIPVFASGSRLEVAGADDRDLITAVLGWAAIADDPGARKVLWAWARCRATGASFGELCREVGWPRNTAETARRRGAAAIARALNET